MRRVSRCPSVRSPAIAPDNMQPLDPPNPVANPDGLQPRAIKPLSLSESMTELQKALADFAKASAVLTEAWMKSTDELNDAYPFPADFQEVNSDIQSWKEANIKTA